jgi:hypothetical protein
LYGRVATERCCPQLRNECQVGDSHEYLPSRLVCPLGLRALVVPVVARL